ncbi:hypothetical protein HDV02_005228 [Globomyces sp. JEL0801]|nr:hypothetical protein HDV02_005228 [Globomyces sp. JEL0801]
MSTSTEVVIVGLREATESLRRAEDRLNIFMNQNPTDFTSVGYLALSAEVTRCTAREERAQQTLVELSKHQLSQITAERDILLNRSPTLAIITIKDMLTNFDFPICDVHRSHIFQASWEEGKFTELILAGGLQFQHITKDSPENMLLLHDNVETKYDCGQLLIEYDESSQNFICRILDQGLVNDLIFLHPQPVTFGQYDGQVLHFPSASRPLRRLIRFRAIVNRLVAIDRGYIQAEDYQYLMDSDDWSPGTKALFESIIDWNPNIPKDSHLYVNTSILPE